MKTRKNQSADKGACRESLAQIAIGGTRTDGVARARLGPLPNPVDRLLDLVVDRLIIDAPAISPTGRKE
jgi:hypothetical protein